MVLARRAAILLYEPGSSMGGGPLLYLGSLAEDWAGSAVSASASAGSGGKGGADVSLFLRAACCCRRARTLLCTNSVTDVRISRPRCST